MTPTAVLMLALTLVAFSVRLVIILRDWHDYRHRAGATRS